MQVCRGSTGTECGPSSRVQGSHVLQSLLSSRSSGWGQGLSLNHVQAFISGKLD